MVHSCYVKTRNKFIVEVFVIKLEYDIADIYIHVHILVHCLIPLWEVLLLIFCLQYLKLLLSLHSLFIYIFCYLGNLFCHYARCQGNKTDTEKQLFRVEIENESLVKQLKDLQQGIQKEDGKTPESPGIKTDNVSSA